MCLSCLIEAVSVAMDTFSLPGVASQAICLSISLPVLSVHNSTAILQSNPDSGINSNVYICALGLLTAVWSLVGYDSTAHMIEETKQADSTAGWPMLYAIGLAAITGLPVLLALTLCLQVMLHSKFA